MHYQEKIDEIFNDSLHSNRTLRTLFDCLSHDWEQTNIEQKEALIMKLYCSDHPIEYYVEGYKHFYLNELANKAYVVDCLPKSIRLLVLNVKDETLRTTLLKLYVSLGDEKNDK